MSSEGEKPNKPTEDVLIRVWENERISRNFAVKLMWENMKFFGGFIGSLLTAYSGLVGLIVTAKINIPYAYNFVIFLPVPVVILILALYARNDLIERRRRFLLVVTHLFKLEQLLGLHDKIGNKLQYFKEDEYLFTEYQENLTQGKSKKTFIDVQMSKNPSAFKAMQNVYIMFVGIAVGLIIFGIAVLCNPSIIQVIGND
jgi:hypothetical protein